MSCNGPFHFRKQSMIHKGDGKHKLTDFQGKIWARFKVML